MLEIDLHIHSINSGHAYGTIQEIINEASRKNMKMISVSDHGPSMRGAISPIHFVMGNRAPKKVGDLRVLWGCEANVVDGDGHIDLDSRELERLDVVLVGFHGHTPYRDLGRERNTRAIQQALAHPRVKVLTHPLYPQFECNIDAVLETALEQHVLLELNCAYVSREPDEIARWRRMVELVKSNGGKLIANSDAHFLHEIGDDAALREVWDEIGMTEDLLMNNFPKELEAFLGLRPLETPGTVA